MYLFLWLFLFLLLLLIMAKKFQLKKISTEWKSFFLLLVLFNLWCLFHNYRTYINLSLLIKLVQFLLINNNNTKKISVESKPSTKLIYNMFKIVHIVIIIASVSIV